MSMSDVPQGPGWWQASDLKWYPPESAPGYVPPQAYQPQPQAYQPQPQAYQPQAPQPYQPQQPVGGQWGTAPQAGYRAPLPHAKPKKGIARKIGLALFVVVMLAGLGLAVKEGLDRAERDEDGTVNEAGNVDVLTLKVGDCFDEPGGGLTEAGELVYELRAIPCAEPHQGEVYHEIVATEGDDVPFPGDTAIGDRAKFECATKFEAFVGRPLQESELTYAWLVPTEESWNYGDRGSTCYVIRDDSAQVTGSANGSGW